MKTLSVGFAILAALTLYVFWGVGNSNLVEFLKFYFPILLGPLTIVARLGPVKFIRLAYSEQHIDIASLISCLLAVLGVAASPLLRGRTKLVVTIIGFSAWAFCEIVVASAGI